MSHEHDQGDVDETLVDDHASAGNEPVWEARRSFPREETVPLAWQVGDLILDHYQVTEILGQGGMGLVYKVRQLSWKIDLAVKSPRPDRVQTRAQQEQFVREALAWVNLGLHPHIVNCFYVRILGGLPRVFAEYVDGGSLAALIRSGLLYAGGHAQALERMLDIAIQAAWGLQYAHLKQLVHQDVKPGNLMVTRDGLVKVTDFGLVGGRGMTIPYRSPEQAAQQPLTWHTDLWSWGVSVLEMFVGEARWLDGQAAAAALAAYPGDAPATPMIPSMPPRLMALLRRCFQQRPADRPSHLDEVLAALHDLYREQLGLVYRRQAPHPATLRADGLNNRAVSLWELGDPVSALDSWEQALRADPAHLPARVNLVLHRWERGEVAIHDARPHLQRLVAEGSAAPREHHVWLAQLDFCWGYYDDALRRLEPLLALGEPAPEEWNLYGALLWARRDYERAEQAFVAAARGSPRHTFFLANRDLCRVARGNLPVERFAQRWPEQYPLRPPLPSGPVTMLGGNPGPVEAQAEPRWMVTRDGAMLVVHDALSPGCPGQLSAHISAVTCYAVAEQVGELVSGGLDRAIFLWRLGSAQPVGAFYDLESEPASVGFLRGGAHIWALTARGALYILDVPQKLRHVKTLLPARSARGGTCWACADGEQGRLLVAGVGRHIHIWETDGYREVRCFETSSPMSGGRLTHDGGALLASPAKLGAGKAQASDANPGLVVYALRPEGGPVYEPLVHRPTALVLPRGARDETSAELAYKQFLRVAEARIEQGDGLAALAALRKAQQLPDRSHDPRALALLERLAQIGGRRSALRSYWRVTEIGTGLAGDLRLDAAPDGDLVVVVANEALGGIAELSLRGQEVVRLRRDESRLGHLASVAVDPLRRCYAAGGIGQVKLAALGDHRWLTERGPSDGFTLGVGEDRVEGLCIAPDGRWIAIGRGSDVQLMELVADGPILRLFKGQILEGCGVPIRLLRCSPDGRYLLAGAGKLNVFGGSAARGELLLWELPNPTPVWVRHHEGGWTRSAAWRQGEEQVATVTDDGTIRIFTLRAGREAAVFKTGVICAASALLPDGSFAALAAHDDTLYLWDLEANSCAARIDPTVDRITGVCFAGSPQQGLVVHANGALSVWGFDWEWSFGA